MQIRLATGFDGWNGEAEARHYLPFEGAERLSADVACDDEEAHRQDVDIVPVPNGPLEPHRVGIIGVAGELANLHQRSACSCSESFAACHNASISSSDASAVVL